MPSGTIWTKEEEQHISELIQKHEKEKGKGPISWCQISKLIQVTDRPRKTAKQCEDRWKNHINANSKREVTWTNAEIEMLFSLQQIHGNRWSEISYHFGDKTETLVKNFFYSTLRKAIRLINAYMSIHKSRPTFRKMRLFSESCVCKIVAQEQGKTNRMRVLNEGVQRLARQIKKALIAVYSDPKDHEMVEAIIPQLTEFNRNCRRLRGKQRNPDEESEEESDSSKSEKKSSKKNVKKEAESPVYLNCQKNGNNMPCPENLGGDDEQRSPKIDENGMEDESVTARVSERSIKKEQTSEEGLYIQKGCEVFKENNEIASYDDLESLSVWPCKDELLDDFQMEPLPKISREQGPSWQDRRRQEAYLNPRIMGYHVHPIMSPQPYYSSYWETLLHLE